MSDLTFLTVHQLAQGIREKNFSAVELAIAKKLTQTTDPWQKPTEFS